MMLSRAIRSSRQISLLALLVLLGGCSSTPERSTVATSPLPEGKILGTSAPAPEEKPAADPGFHGMQPEIATTAPLQVVKIAESSDLWDHIRKGFRLPNFQSSRVAFYERQFSRHPENVARIFERAQWFMPTIYQEIKERQLPTELVLLPVVESAYKTAAKSPTGASGLWQFIPSTGRLYGMTQNWWMDARRDPFLSTNAALQFLGELHDRFDGDWLLAIAGYNAGGRTIERAVEKNQRAGKPAKFEHLQLRKETRDYIPKLIAWRNIVSDPEKYKLKLEPMPLTPQIVQVDAGSQISLPLFANKLGVNKKTMGFLNATYRRGVTPPDGPHTLALPASKNTLALSMLKTLDRNDRISWRHHRVQKGEVLGRISQKYGVSVAAIQRSNKLHNHVIKPGQVLLIPAYSAPSLSGGIAKKPAKKAAKKPTSAKVASASKTRQPRTRHTHKVQSGDTLSEIARVYGVEVKEISRWNGIKPSQPLKPGQQLVIYVSPS